MFRLYREHVGSATVIHYTKTTSPSRKKNHPSRILYPLNLRIKLATQGDTYTQIIQELGFVERFGSIYGESSKAWPRGVTKDTPYPDLVMRKQHLILRSYTDEKVLSPDFFESIIHDCRTARPWMDWLQDV